MLPTLERVRHEGLIAVCLALLLGLFAVAVAGVIPREDGVPVAIDSLPGQPAVVGAAGGGVLLRPLDGRHRVAARLRFDLPADDDARWVVRLERDALESVWLQRDDWRSPVRGFFSPDPDEGVLPGSFLFALPAHWRGPTQVELHATGDIRSALHPQVMREAQATRLEQYGVAASAMIYASLFTIGLLALALFWASRDRLFLALFAYLLVALLTLAALNGHLYQLPGLRAFAFWGGSGLFALGLLLSASWLQILLQYAGTPQRQAGMRTLVDRASLGLVALAALSLLNVAPISRLLQHLHLAAWTVALLLGLAVLIDAGRRRVPMAWPMAVLAVLTLAGVVMLELSVRGHLLDTMPVRYGHQLALVVGVAILSVGLISRIGEYRHQRDRELLARTDTERRMQREAARSDLASDLQAQLRAVPVADIEWTAFRLLIDRLSPLLPMERCTVAVHGYHGRDVLVVDPVAHMETARVQLDRRQLALKRQAANGIALQQPVTVEGQPSIVAIEAVVPLQLRSPAWGALLLQRTGAEGFTTGELSLASDFGRVTLLHIDQAVAAVNLRRSAELDALTGSFNRRTIDQWLARTFVESARAQQPASVLFIDLDHFKAINDRYGHACGDFCLRHVAMALRGALHEGDLFGRYGGEEFIALLPGRGGAAAREIAEQLRMAVESLCPEWNGAPLQLTVSIGVATRLEHEDAPEATLARADRALYAAKGNGRNCVQVAPAVFR